jgi:hypothetical protein
VTKEKIISRVSTGQLIEVFNFGETYLSDFIDSKSQAPMKSPLVMALDPHSGVLQLKHTAPPDRLYRNYWYRSGVNKTMVEELRKIVLKSLSLIHCNSGDTVLDIASNDGTLLSFYPKELTRIGFDPSYNMCQYARYSATTIVPEYFSSREYFKATNNKAKIITSIAMFYDLDDPHSFIDDINSVMDDDGLWVVQMGYLPLMLKQLAFDCVCHERLEYYSLDSFNWVIKKHGLKIVDVKLNDINGGSIRIYLRKNSANVSLFATSPYREMAEYRVNSLLEYEKTLRLNDPQIYRDWFNQVMTLKEKTMSFIRSEKERGKVIWGYGASTKGNTLMQLFGLDNTLLDAIADRNPEKYGKLTVGTNIPIVSEAEMRRVRPDYLVIFPWGFVSEFKEREKKYLQSGGKFIVPCPKVEIISYDR